MFGIDHKIERAAQKGAAFSAAFVIGMVGCGFLTAAAWMLLTKLESELFAASIIGAVYVGVAAIIVAVSMKSSRHREPARPDLSEAAPLPLIIGSFMQGFETARKSR